MKVSIAGIVLAAAALASGSPITKREIGGVSRFLSPSKPHPSIQLLANKGLTTG